ncbi:protein LURP-one-related 17 isoform X1 [Jatropha curcas]|uniref:protein LURP-one-related 17 isoform X1 n=1 Tax=Jatropha curcas TaxID=180498 RepID=UPI0005FC1D6D|nr:protein LURP-one-related 17 isoform X1 [Jatropha curcas]
MFFFLKSLSRSVHDDIEEHHHQEQDQTSKIVTDGTCTSLTVWRKSLLVNCNGFTVINSNGDLVYRVDNYIVRPHELVLMDASGKSILTMHRKKKLGLGDSWLVYEGEVGKCCSTTRISKKPIWSVKKHSNILQASKNNNNNNVLAYVFRGTAEKRYSYVIEGSYTQRSCKVVDESRTTVAEIKRKEAIVRGVSFGVEVFVLVVHGGFDPGFAMALVLLLDQMFS